MKHLNELWITPLFLVPLGCTSRHAESSESHETSHREAMEEGEENEEDEEMEESPDGRHEEADEENHERESTNWQASTVIAFGAEAVGSLPAGWKIEGTNQKGPLATWQVVADPGSPSQPNVLALTSPNHDSGDTFNLCWTDKVRFHDGAIEVSMKPVSGREDQGGGLIWRAQDKDDYYICRANPLESNFRVYYVKDGSRHQLASAQVEIATGKWHTIRIEHEGDRIECSLDGRELLHAKDATFPGEGGIGLWTKADAASEFDDLKVSTR